MRATASAGPYARRRARRVIRPIRRLGAVDAARPRQATPVPATRSAGPVRPVRAPIARDTLRAISSRLLALGPRRWRTPGRGRGAGLQRRSDHLLAVPLLTTPTPPFGIDDASTAAAAAWVLFHVCWPRQMGGSVDAPRGNSASNSAVVRPTCANRVLVSDHGPLSRPHDMLSRACRRAWGVQGDQGGEPSDSQPSFMDEARRFKNGPSK